MTKVDIINITKKFNEAKTEVNKKEMIIKEKETEIAELRARLKDTEKIKESEIENKDNYIKELEDKNQQLSKSVKNLESINKELESTKQQSAQMKKQIEILEGEKEILKRRMTTLESYINDGCMNRQLQNVLEDIKKRIEGTY
jgi:chromosome segregation ATPase